MSEADVAEADSLEQQLYGDQLPVVWFAAVAAVQGDETRFERLLAEHAASTVDPLWTWTIWTLMPGFREFEAAERIAAVDTLGHRPPMARAAAYLYLAESAVAHGRWSEARRYLEGAARFDPFSARVMRASFATLPFLDVPPADLEALRRDLEAWDAQAETPADATPLVAAAMPSLRLYLLGLTSARLGDAAGALAYSGEIARPDSPERLATVERDLTRTVEAQVALDRGRPAEALELLEPVRGEVPLELLRYYARLPGTQYLSPFGQDRARFLRARSLHLLDREEEALRWLRNGFDLTPGDVVYMAPRDLAVAEIHAGRGEHARAAERYRRFLELWGGADERLQPVVEAARRRLEEIGEAEGS